MKDENGIWRTISGRKVFIKRGQSLSDAMRESGKFKSIKKETETGMGHTTETDFSHMKESEKESITDYIMGGYKNRSEGQTPVNLNKIISDNPGMHWNDGELYRGVTMTNSQVELLQSGAIINQNGPSSWSSSQQVADGFTRITLSGEYSNQVIFVDKTTGTRNAISIKGLSMAKGENEVLYSGKSNFKVLAVNTSNRIIYVDVEEI